MTSPLDAMQAAVDVVLTSPHPTNKIAAALFFEERIVARTNSWPRLIEKKLGIESRIGNSSGTVHAEVNCLLDFPIATDGASLCVTDPFCPNCAKNLAEAGIKKIYIDHKGFDKDFAQRRGDEFSNMSLRIAARAGISIYEARRREGLIVPLQEMPVDYRAPQDNPIKIDPVIGEPDLTALRHSVIAKADRWGCAFAKDREGRIFSLVASAHATIGYSETSADDREALSQPEGKYNFYIEPMNRLMMGAARHGLKLMNGLIHASCTPTSRELVNLAAAGITSIHTDNPGLARDPDALAAKDSLGRAGILTINSD